MHKVSYSLPLLDHLRSLLILRQAVRFSYGHVGVSFWLTQDRITYLDDSGFWAFGQYQRGILHLVGYVIHPDGLE